MNRLLLFVVVGVIVSAFQATAGTMPTSTKYLDAYVKGVRADGDGTTFLVIDKSQDIVPTGTTTTIASGTTADFWLYIGNSSSITDGPAVRTVVAALLAAKAAGDKMRFYVYVPTAAAPTYNTVIASWPVQ